MKVVCRYGDYVVPDEDDLIAASLRNYGEWAQEEISIIATFLKPGDIVIDAGAYIGTHTRAFSTLVGHEGWVHAFEPNAYAYPFLFENAKLAPLSNISTYPVALGAQEDRRAVVDSEGSNHGSSRLASTSEGEYQETIPVKTLDSFALNKVDFIKADVEGMELNVLLGSEELITSSKPVIFLEINSISTAVGLLEWGNRIGYSAYGLLSAAYNPDNFNLSRMNFFGISKELGIILVHNDRQEEWADSLGKYHLPEVKTYDDLALLLLNKPQYFYEVLSKGTAASMLGVGFTSPLSEEKDRKISDLNQILLNNEVHLAETKQALTDCNEQIASLQRSIEERDEHLARSGELLANCETQITNLKYKVAGFDERITSLTQNLALRDLELFECREHLQQAQNQANSSLHEVKLLSRIVADKEEELIASRQSLSAYRDELSTIRSSNSWSLTRPFRVAGRLIRGDVTARQVVHHLISYLQRREASALIQTPIKRARAIAVVLPIYRDINLTRACVESAIPGILEVEDAVLVMVNDASPESGMSEMLDHLVSLWPERVVLLTNEQNLGFVATVNKALRLYEGYDIVLLNSDVIVPHNWLQRLALEAYSGPKIGTVTPLSNNTTICTFPEFLQDNPIPFDLEVNQIDAVFRRSRLPNIETPTGIGFCMYIRRDCLVEAGLLDQGSFPRGYGEENDFCQRALKKGWLNLITPNMFAFHKGGVSFGEEKASLINNAMRVIDRLHPNYHADVQSFIRNNPLKQARLKRLCDLLAAQAIPKILHISHGLGGGTSQYIKELASYYCRRNEAFTLVLIPQGSANNYILRFGYNETADEVALQLPEHFDFLVGLLRALNVSLVHFNHILNVNPVLFSLPSALSAKYYLTIHDFYLLSGNPTLTDFSGKYSASAVIDDLVNPLYPLPSGISPNEWRQKYYDFVAQADRVIFPSAATKTIFCAYFNVSYPVVAWHIEWGRNIERKVAAFLPKESYVIGVLGALSKEKGADYLEAMAKWAKSQNLPIKFTLIGYAYRSLDVVKATGPYRSQDLSSLIRQEKCDLILFPACWPETYSYTLSSALDSGIPIMAPALGAFPERLSEREHVMLFEYGCDPIALVKQLMSFIRMLASGEASVAQKFKGEKSSKDFYKVSYLDGLRISSGDSGDFSGGALAKQSLDFFFSRSLPSRKTSGELILRLIFILQSAPGFRKLANIIPFRFRRYVKRCLTKRPIHEVLQ